MGFVETVRQMGEGFLDLLYPPRCLICGRDAEPVICETCAAEFTAIPEPVCARCGRPNDSPECRFCTAHKQATGGLDWAFDAARAAAIYEGPLRHAIHQLKYRYVEALGIPLGEHLANRALVDELISPDCWRTIDAVVPMPISNARRRRRGYNQTELLARPVADNAGLPLLTNAIRRVGRSTAQVGLTLETRRSNVSGASFALPEPSSVRGKTILLVDDVFTTGTSADACARALRETGGASAVYVLALAAGN